MALSAIPSDNELFGVFEDQELFTMDSLGAEFEKSLRPSIAEKLQVGFLSSDQYTQTNTSEILDIKQITETVRMLLEEMGTLKRDLQFSKQVLKATFEEKLQNKAYDLHAKLNDRLRDLQNIHEERVSVMRRSYKQQLQDALVKMAAYYKKYYEAKMGGKLESKDSPATRKKILLLEADLDRKNSLIQLLEGQVEQMRIELDKPVQPEIKVDTSEIEALQEANGTLKTEIAKLSDRVEDLATSLEFRDEKIKQLGLELMEHKAEADTERDTSRKFARQIEELKKQLDEEKMSASKALDHQKLAMERDIASKLASEEENKANLERERAKLMETLEEEMKAKLLEERKMFEMKLAQEREDSRRRERAAENSKSLELLANQQQQEILILKKRLATCQKQWELKFAVLRASLHALKDESYIRLQLQKQAATLKYASISYGSEVPPPTAHMASMFAPGAVQQQQQQPMKPPKLPGIKQRGKRSFDAKRTNTIPSGIGTEPFSGDEEEQDIEIDNGFIPLPPKPNMGDYMPAVDSGF